MAYPKQLRSSYVNDREDSKTKRLKETTIDSNDSLIKSATCFEDLSNDIIYEIFDFLDFRPVYDGFANLNKRFQHLLTNSNLPINFNMSSVSKSNFQHYCTHIIMPNTHRIKSLHLSNPFSIDLLLTHDSIMSKLVRLQTLILNDIQSKDVEQLLSYLISLPCLSSLFISCIDDEISSNKLYREIFRLPMLKYCKILLNDGVDSEPSLPIASNEFSPIEHLIINNKLKMFQLTALLSYVPQLRRLSCENISQSVFQQIMPCSTKLNYLTHASLNMTNITFDEFELLTKNLFLQLQVLYITTKNDIAYVDAYEWERIILSYMPHLRIFDIQCMIFSQRDNYTTDIAMIDRFHSQFWLERQWFITYTVESTELGYYLFFYSINPYRRKYYNVYGKPVNDISSRRETRNIDAVRHIHIKREQTTDDCINYFSNATELTLAYKAVHIDQNPSFIVLNCIAPLKQITKLNISVDILPFKRMIQLLCSIPNVHTLILEYIHFDNKDLASIRRIPTFQSVATRNNIKNMYINSRYTFDDIKILIHLCHRLQCLTICKPDNDFEEILQYLLSRDNTQHLFSLCITHVSETEIESTKSLLGSQELLNDYLMKRVTQASSDNIYLWW